MSNPVNKLLPHELGTLVDESFLLKEKAIIAATVSDKTYRSGFSTVSSFKLSI